MTQKCFLGRTIPAMVAPFDSDNKLSKKGVLSLIERFKEAGITSVLINGTTGESPTLSMQEKLNLVSWAKEYACTSLQIIANIGTNSTAASLELLEKTKSLDVDAYMAVVPYYNKPPQEGIYQHFSALAKACDKPLIMYNIPGRCGVNMTAETTLRLARDCENIVAVKEASGDIEQIRQVISEAPDGFMVFSGDDALTLELMKHGAYGVISTIANIAPEEMHQLVSCAAQDNFDEAESLHERLLPCMNGLFETANPILVKEALKLQHYEVGSLRLPLISATKEQSVKLKTLLEQAGLIQ